MDREQFLERIRQAARAGAAYRIEPVAVEDNAGYIGAGPDLCVALAQEIEAVGGTAQIVDNWESASAAVEATVAEHNPRSALCWRHEVLDRINLSQLLESRGVEHIDYDKLQSLSPAAQREKILAADIGITSVDYAIAETGTLVVAARPGQERVASLLPPVHLAIVAAEQIVPDLFDVFASLRPDDLPSNLTLITGPSKTGDIELELTTGVHGPGQWRVIIVRST